MGSVSLPCPKLKRTFTFTPLRNRLYSNKLRCEGSIQNLHRTFTSPSPLHASYAGRYSRGQAYARVGVCAGWCSRGLVLVRAGARAGRCLRR